jgi:hypothetical protein
MNKYQELTEGEWEDLYPQLGWRLGKKHSLRDFMSMSREERCLVILDIEEKENIEDIDFASPEIPMCPDEDTCELVDKFFNAPEEEKIKNIPKLQAIVDDLERDRLNLILGKERYLKVLQEEMGQVAIDIWKLKNFN